MKKSLLSLSLCLAIAGIGSAQASDAKPALGAFGIELNNRDLKAKPGDDFDRYANGTWHDAYVLKDYETDYGSFDVLADRSEEQVNAIIKDMAARTDLKPGSDEIKIRDLYNSWMDQAARDAKGVEPVRPILDRIAKIDSKARLTASASAMASAAACRN